MEDKYLVYTETIKVPIYHVCFDVYVGYSMSEIKEHVEDTFSGLELSQLDASKTQVFTFLVDHFLLGSHLSVLLSLDDKHSKDAPSLSCSIVHEAVHLSWCILEMVGITLTADNHEVQAYLIEFLVKELKNLVKKARANLNEDKLDNL